MMWLQLVLFLIFSAFILTQNGSTAANVKYKPTWKSLDTRPLPGWYDEAKLGIFMHWGVFSVPSFSSEWFWWAWKGSKEPAVVDFMNKNYPPGFTYADFASMFKAEFFDPNEWADILAASGAKYIVLTSKHHEGFTNWPSDVSWNWNSMDVGPKRDLVGDLAKAVRNRTQLHFGLYHSLFEWFHPLFLKDQANKFKTQSFVKTKTMPELYDIVMRYEPEVIWSDGDWGAPDTYWNSTEFIAWLYNESPVKDQVVVNDRWGQGVMCHHGDFYTCQDKFNPGILQNHKWENAMTVDRKSWGYRRTTKMADILSMDELVATLVETVSCGGNMLMNIGPTADGRFVPVFEERLRQMGQWLGVNGDAIYGTTPWAYQNDTTTHGVWYTSKKMMTGTDVYAIALKWPSDTLILGAITPTPGTVVSLVGVSGTLPHTARPGGGIDISVAGIKAGQLPCQWGWVFKLEHVVPAKRRSTALKWQSLRHAERVVINY